MILICSVFVRAVCSAGYIFCVTDILICCYGLVDADQEDYSTEE